MRIIFLLLLSFNVMADGVNGLSYTIYSSTGATPSTPPTNATIIATGTAPNLDFNWGGGNIMNTSYYDRVAIHFTGFILWPGATGQKTVSFYDSSDDGFKMSINNTPVISNWVEQGPSSFNGSGSITLTAGNVYPIDIWWYENGGGAAVRLFWNISGSIVITPSSNLATTSTYFPPVLCCGGSPIPFSTNTTNANKVYNFYTRTNKDSQVHIEQIGNNNTITATQFGAENNYIKYNGSGDNNTITMNQSSNTNSLNYIDSTVSGNDNHLQLTQQSTGGNKGIFTDITGSHNNLTLLQKDNGNHYAEVSLTGDNKTIDITQQGSASHMARVELSGQSTSLNLTQSGSTQQFYSITFNCATVGGCQPIQVNQGP
jgi:hypothetical protein